jgi:hypothetical protein
MQWRLAAAGVALLAAFVGAAHAATTLYVTGGADTPVTYGRTFFRTGPGDHFSIYTDAVYHGLYVSTYDPIESTSIYANFLPPKGELFVPKLYEGVAYAAGDTVVAGVRVDGGSAYGPTSAALDVLDAAYDAGGNLVRFVANFSQSTTGTATLYGSVRMNAGDGTCTGAPDGTPCDDADGCTATSSCAGGHCVAGARTACTAAPNDCHDDGVCDPRDGTCGEPLAKWNGTRCADGDVCSLYDLCADGLCTPGLFVDTCSDGSACTYAFCDATAGCRYPTIPGACDAPGIASTLAYLHIDGVAGEPQIDFTLVPPDFGSVISLDYENGVGAVLYRQRDGGFVDYYAFRFYGPDPTPLQPGTYENASAQRTPGAAALDIVSLPYLGCDAPIRRFVVHEAAYATHGATTTLSAFAADFSIRCPAARELRGAIRFRAGDVTCAGAADGTPCDDLNACTGSSACQGGLCVGADPVTCAPTTCRDLPVCDPTSGTCALPAPLADGTACSDPATCVDNGACTDGACVGKLPTCDDFDVCTADACTATGCTHEPLDGSCWELRGSATFIASVRGATCACTARAHPAPIALYADGTFARPGGILRCPDGRLVVVPNEIGTATSGKRGRLSLRTTNLQSVLDSVAECQTVSQPIKYREWAKVDVGRGRLRGQHLETTRSGVLHLKTIIRYRGTPTNVGTLEGVSVSVRRCVDQLVNCLRDKLTN